MSIASEEGIEYLEHRQTYVGGGDAAAVLGLIPQWDTRRDVWLKKTIGDVSELNRVDNRHIRRGKRMEGIAFDLLVGNETWQTAPLAPFAEQSDHRRHPEYDWIGGTPDAEDPDRIYEIKAPNSDKVEDIKRNGLPTYWYVQGQHYSMLRGKPVTFVIMDYNRWTLYDIPTEPKPELHEKMIADYKRFWEDVQSGTPPRESQLKNKQIRTGKGGAKLNNLLGEYYVLHEASKKADADRKAIKGKILTRIGNLKQVETSDFRATVSDRTSSAGNAYKVLRVTPIDGLYE